MIDEEMVSSISKLPPALNASPGFSGRQVTLFLLILES
jgi:hypothetical protein